MGDKPIMSKETSDGLAKRLVEAIPVSERGKVADAFQDQPSAVFSDATDVDSVVVNLSGDIMRGRRTELASAVDRI
jgi:hypothetical protein